MKQGLAQLAPWLAGGLAIFGVGLYVVFVVLALQIERVATASFDTGVPLDEVPIMTSNIFAVLVGAFLAVRRPDNRIGWLLMLVGYGFLTFPAIVLLLAFFTRSGGQATTGLLVLAWIANWSWALSFIGIVYTFLLFPNGRPLSPFWRRVGWAGAPALGGVLIIAALLPGPMQAAPQWENPFGLAIAAQLAQPLIGAMLIFELLSMIALIVRFVRSRGVERQQLKWVAFAVALQGITSAISIGWARLGPDLPMIERAIRWLDGVSPILIMAAIVIAVMRYRLYDIDIIINRTLVYSLLTLMLGLVYVGCILMSRTLIAPLTGGSELAIVVSTLAIATLFTPLRRRIQNTIDRRFYRRKYDAAKVLAAFGATARDETDLEQLTDELVRVVDETVQPEFVGLWLKEALPQRSPGSTRLNATEER